MASEWQVLSLADAGVILIDCDHRTPIAVESGYPYVTIPQMRNGHIDVSDARKITTADFIEWTRKAKPTGDDVILSRRCNPGETAWVPHGLDFALGQNLVLLRSNGTKIFPPFLRWLVRGPNWWEQIEKFLNVGAVFNSLKCADIPKFMLRLPSFTEQRAIAHILGTLDDKIELNRQMNETLEAMARALFKAWFVDFVPVRAKQSGHWQRGQSLPGLPAHLYDLFPDRLVELESGEIPEGWDVKKVDNFLSLNYGKSLPANSRTTGRVPVYGSGGIIGFHNVALVNEETVIIGRKGTIGSLYWETRPSFPIDTAFYVKPIVPLIFCYHLLETLPLKNMNTDAAVPGLNRENVYRIEVVSPSKCLMDKFSGIAMNFRIHLCSLQNEIRYLETIRDTLLPRLITGELRVMDVNHIGATA